MNIFRYILELANTNPYDVRFDGKAFFQYHNEQLYLFEQNNETLTIDKLDYVPITQTEAQSTPFMEKNGRVDWFRGYVVPIKVTDNIMEEDDETYKALKWLTEELHKRIVEEGDTKVIIKCGDPIEFGRVNNGGSWYVLFNFQINYTELKDGFFGDEALIEIAGHDDDFLQTDTTLKLTEPGIMENNINITYPDEVKLFTKERNVETLTEQIKTIDGYEFDRWFDTDNQEVITTTHPEIGSIDPLIIDPILRNWNIVAEYIAQYTVQFFDCQAENIDTQYVLEGQAATEPTFDVEEEYQFDGWNTTFNNITEDTDVFALCSLVPNFDFNFTNVQTYSGTVDTNEVTVQRDGKLRQTFTYQFDEPTVRWVKNDTTMSGQSIDVVAGDVIKIRVSVDQIAGTNSFGTVDVDNITNLSVVRDVTSFEFNVEYTLVSYSFEDYDNTVLKSGKVVKGTSPTPPSDPERDCYTFDEWQVGGVGVVFPYDIDESTTFTAAYTALPEYTVTFRDDDATVLKTETVCEGNDATPPTTPTRDGYVMTDWDGNYTNVQMNETVTAVYREEFDFNFNNISGETPQETNEVTIGVAGSLRRLTDVDQFFQDPSAIQWVINGSATGASLVSVSVGDVVKIRVSANANENTQGTITVRDNDAYETVTVTSFTFSVSG